MIKFWEGRKIEDRPEPAPLVTARAYFSDAREGNVRASNAASSVEGVTLWVGDHHLFNSLSLSVADMKSAHTLLGKLIAAYEGA